MTAKAESRRGSTMIESALAMVVFALIVAGTVELSVAGLASNSIAFAAQRAARYASVRGSASGHPATVADIQANALSYAAPLTTANLAVNVSWTPNNSPGSTVLVTVSYDIKPSMLLVSSGKLTLRCSARQTISQ
jgi:Flp pilus assembly protein TadG